MSPSSTRLTRARGFRALGCALFVAAYVAGCRNPGHKTKTIADGERPVDVTESVDAGDASPGQYPDGAQDLAKLNAELRARHAEELDRMLLKIEQAYLKNQDGWMQVDPIREEQVRTIWNTRPDKIR